MNIYKEKLGVAVRFSSSSSINGSDETLGCKSLTLSHFYSIEDEALRFCHVTREEASCNLVCSIMNRCLKFLDGSSNLGHYNSSDERLGLIRLIK